MAVAIDATGTKLVGGSSAVTTLNYTGLTITAALSNSALVAWIFWGDTTAPTSLTAKWDNTGTPQTMTLIGSVSFTGTGGTVTAAAFGLLNPTAGNKTLNFSWTGTGNFPTACAISLSGVTQASVAAAFKNFVSNTGNVPASGGTLSTTVTSAVGDMVIGGFIDALSLTGINNTTVFSDTTSSGGDTAGCRAAGAATVTVTGTGGSGSGAGVVFGFDVAQVSAVTISGIGWFEPWDHPKYSMPLKDAGLAPAYVRPPTVFTPISGSAWNAQRDHVKLPPKDAFDDSPALGGFFKPATSLGWFDPPEAGKVTPKVSFSSESSYPEQPVTTSVGISGIAWFEPPEAGRPPQRVSISYESSYPEQPLGTFSFGWYEPPEAYRVTPKISISLESSYPEQFVPAVGISGIGWYEPPEAIRIVQKISYSSDSTYPEQPLNNISFGWFEQPEAGKVVQKVSFTYESAYPEQPPFTAVGISGMAWFAPRENDALPKGKYLTDPILTPFQPQITVWSFLVGDTVFIRDAPVDSPPGFGQPVTQAFTPISGIAWLEPVDQARAKVSFSTPSAYGAPSFPAVGVSGIAWFEPPEAGRVTQKVSYTIESSYPEQPQAAVGVSGISWFEQWEQIKPVVKIKWADVAGATLNPSVAQSIGWFTPLDELKPRSGLKPQFYTDPIQGATYPVIITASFFVGDTAFLRKYAPVDFAPAFGFPTTQAFTPISGIAWFEPPERDRVPLKQRIESVPGISLTPATLPVGISGIAWFEPPPGSVKASISFSEMPAFQQPIVQVTPPVVEFPYNVRFVSNVGTLMGRF